MKKIGFSLLASVLLAACASQQPAPVSEPPSQAATQSQSGTAAATVGSAGSAANVAGAWSVLTDPNNILSKRMVYFDLDKYNVKDEYSALVKAHGAFLNSNRNAQVSLQGHTDERGTAEYNLALGQKRADAVKRALTAGYGVDSRQIETISYGKEMPAAQGSNEEAWAKNRRVEIVYPGEAKFPKK